MVNIIKNIIFDFDGVILDSVNAKTNAFFSMYLKYGHDIAKKVKNYHLKNGGISRFEKFKYWHKVYLNKNINKKELKELTDQFSKLVFNKVINSNQIEGSFNFIVNNYKNYNFFIVTGTPENEIQLITKKLKIHKYFNKILGSPSSKIECCKKLINSFNIKSEETIFVGDALADYEAAKFYNFRFALKEDKTNLKLFQKVKCIRFTNFYEFEKKFQSIIPKILITSTSFQDTPGSHKDLLKSQNWIVDYLRGPLKEKEIIEDVDKYDGIICGDDEYTENVLEKASKGQLKVLSKYGVGLDKIDLKSAKKFQIPVTNCPGINQNSVAEHVFGLLLSFFKNIHIQFNTTQSFSWERKIGSEVFGKTIGIFGFGAIGKEVARISEGFKMNVIVYDPFLKSDIKSMYPEISFENELDQIFFNSDVITLHAPLNESTRHIINKNIIDNFLLKKPVIINTARAGLVDSNAIIDGLKNYKISGYLCDVLDNEPIDKHEKLVGIQNVIITPHVGSRTYENVEKQGIKAIQNVINFLND